MKLTLRSPPWLKAVVVAVLALDAAILVLAAKREFLPTYLEWEIPAAAAALLLVALVAETARRVLAVSNLATWSVAIPLLVLLAIDLAVTPLPYELAHHAVDLPRPEGEVAAPLLSVARRFERAHPATSVEFRYGGGRDLPTFTNESIAALERAGWTVTTAQHPAGDGPQDYGLIVTSRGPFHANCVIGHRSGYVDWSGPLTVLGCHVRV